MLRSSRGPGGVSRRRSTDAGARARSSRGPEGFGRRGRRRRIYVTLEPGARGRQPPTQPCQRSRSQGPLEPWARRRRSPATPDLCYDRAAGPGLGASSAEGPIEQRAMVIKVKRGVFITTIQVIIIIIQLEVITLCILSCRATVICIVKQLATANYW